MAFLNELKKLESERKWFDLTEYIKHGLTHSSTKKDLDLVISILLNNISKIHPISLTSVIVALFPHITPVKASELIYTCVSTLEAGSVLETNYGQEIITLKLYFYIAAIKQSQLEDIEAQLISLKNSRISNENFNLLYLVAALFYETLGNYEEAQEYLFLHAKQTGTVYDIEKLVELSIRSTTFFDFSAISSFTEFNGMKNTSLKNLFLGFQEANISNIKKKDILNILKISDVEQITVKIYLLKITRICFKSENKFVTFDQLIQELQVDEPTLIKLLLRAMGLKVIRGGWIDSEQRVLFFDGVLPRALTDEEFQKMKTRFTELRGRVEKVIGVLEQKWVL